MAEGYVVRRGRTLSGGAANIFLQTDEPPYENGGLWVNTSLEKYATLTSIQTGAEFGQALPYRFNYPVANRTLCGDWFWGAQNTTRSYGYIVGLNIVTGEHKTVSVSIKSDEYLYGMGCFSNGTDTVVLSATTFVAAEDSGWYVYNTTTGSVNEYASVFSIGNTGRYASCQTPNDLAVCNRRTRDNSISEQTYYVSISSRIYSQIATIQSSVDYTWAPGAFTGDRYFLYRISSESTYYMIEVSVPSGVTTQSWQISSGNNNSLYGEYGGNLYLYMDSSDSVYSYNIESGIETKLFTNASAINAYNTMCLKDATFYVTQGDDTDSIFPVNILGDYDSDTVYIQTSGSENLATIASDDRGKFNIPIERVITFPSGSPVDAEAYVSTGEAWTKI